MKVIRLFISCAVIASIGLCSSPSSGQNVIAVSDPLNQWNEGRAKESILTFVETVTDKTNPKFLPARDRLAVFDVKQMSLIPN